jgi:hypothetical protein
VVALMVLAGLMSWVLAPPARHDSACVLGVIGHYKTGRKDPRARSAVEQACGREAAAG